MKKIATTSSLAAVLIALQATAIAAQDMGGMKGMPMDGMKGMQMDKMTTATDGKETVHKAKGTVKKINVQTGVVTLAHGPVQSMNWPPMVMGFKVRDKSLLDKLAEGRQIEFEFMQSGKDYVLTQVK